MKYIHLFSDFLSHICNILGDLSVFNLGLVGEVVILVDTKKPVISFFPYQIALTIQQWPLNSEVIHYCFLALCTYLFFQALGHLLNHGVQKIVGQQQLIGQKELLDLQAMLVAQHACLNAQCQHEISVLLRVGTIYGKLDKQTFVYSYARRVYGVLGTRDV